MVQRRAVSLEQPIKEGRPDVQVQLKTTQRPKG